MRSALVQGLQVNRDLIGLYLRLLGYREGDTIRIRFLGGKGLENLPPEKIECPLQKLDWRKLNDLQNKGYGAYFAVNGHFRQDETKKGRAFFVEWDDLPKPEQWMLLEDLERRGLEKPTFVIESRRSLHAYWVLEKPVEREAWEAVQRNFVTVCKANSAVKNINHLMRLGGSFHIQAGQTPFLCSVEEMGGLVAFERIKNWAEKEKELMALTTLLANSEAEKQMEIEQVASPLAQPVNLLAFLSRKNQELVRNGASVGERNKNGIALACDLIGAEHWLEMQGESPSLSAHSLFLEYCQNCAQGDGWDEREWNRIWESALRHNPNTALSADSLQKNLNRLRGQSNKNTGGKPVKKRESDSDRLMQVVLQECQFWRTPNREEWVDIVEENVRRSMPLGSEEFAVWLNGKFQERFGVLPGLEVIRKVVVGCRPRCQARTTPTRQLYLRVGQHEGTIYVDIGGDEGKIIAISRDGWRVIPNTDCPIRFMRPWSQLPLPIPQTGGNLETLWELIPVAPQDRPLILGWLAFSLVPFGAKPILALHGPKGAGKSTTASFLKRLIDPDTDDFVDCLETKQELAVAARHGHVLIHDNLGYLSEPQQNLLCKVATGTSFSARKLYTDMDAIKFRFLRPQILTSLDCIPTKSDLLDRCLLVGLDRISPEHRKTEVEIEERFQSLAPALLGKILDLIVLGLANYSQVNHYLPRLAHFAKFGIAALGTEFQTRYEANICLGEMQAIEANPLAAAILELANGGDFEGSTTSLLAQLKRLNEDCQRIQKLSARSLGRLLASRALAQDLKAVGVQIEAYRSAKERGWRIAKIPKLNPMTSTPAPTPSCHSPEPAPSRNSGVYDVKDVPIPSEKTLPVPTVPPQSSSDPKDQGTSQMPQTPPPPSESQVPPMTSAKAGVGETSPAADGEPPERWVDYKGNLDWMVRLFQGGALRVVRQVNNCLSVVHPEQGVVQILNIDCHEVPPPTPSP